MEDKKHVRWRRHLPVLMTFLGLQASAASPPPTETLFAACVARATPAPWKVLSTQAFGGLPSIQLEASTSDLGIRHRDTAAHEQNFVELTLATFKRYTVFDPQGLAAALVGGSVKRADSARGVPGSALKEFDIYWAGSGALLMNVGRTHICLDLAGYRDWPNPFMRCESVSEDYIAAFRVSSEAMGQLSYVFSVVDQLTQRLALCMDSAKGVDRR